MTENEITERLERLERDNRRLKAFAVAAFVLAVAIAVIYPFAPEVVGIVRNTMAGRRAFAPVVPQKVTAHEFDVVDQDGKVSAVISGLVFPHIITARLAQTDVNLGTAGLGFSDGSGNQRAMMIFPSDSSNAASLSVGGLAGDGPFGFVVMQVTSDGSSLIDLATSPTADAPGTGHVEVRVDSDGRPRIELEDRQEFEIQLGSAETNTPSTGQTQRSSAASILMSKKKGDIFWRAP